MRPSHLMTSLRHVLAASLVLALPACDEPSAPDPEPEAGYLFVSIDSTTMAIGHTRTPRVVIEDVNGGPLDLSTIRWTSSNPAVVAVDSLGVMTALQPGAAEIVAAAHPLEHRISVRVVEIFAVHLIPDAERLLSGERVSFTIEIDSDVPWTPSFRDVVWSVDNSWIGAVDVTGTLRTVDAGPIEVSASIGGVTGTALVTVYALDTPFTQITAGSSSTCVLRDPGVPYCWGQAASLGLDFASNAIEARPIPHDPDLALYDRLESNNAWMTCGLDDGELFCWGIAGGADRPLFGPNGSPLITYQAPFPLGFDQRFADFSIGDSHACGLDEAGAAFCWGGNEDGQLGNGTTSPSAVPVPVAGGLSFQSISAGGAHTCAVTTTGDVYCWGDDTEGAVQGGDVPCPSGRWFQVGPCALTPVRVEGIPAMTRIAAGGSFGFDEFNCAIAIDGGLWCWGHLFGEPHRMDDRTYSFLSAGADHLCALLEDGRARCVGSNVNGKLAHAGTGSGFAATPVPVYGDLQFSAITAGRAHTCAITLARDDVFCWGANEGGQLGLGHTETATVPRDVWLP